MEEALPREPKSTFFGDIPPEISLHIFGFLARHWVVLNVFALNGVTSSKVTKTLQQRKRNGIYNSSSTPYIHFEL